jgi:predicted nucleic acid-binding protein
VLTLGELRKGVEARRRTDPLIADQLGAWVDGIETTFADRVLAVDAAVARLWGELSARRSLPVVDTLIAATAVGRGLTLVTRNTRDVAMTGVRLLNPWQGSGVEARP